MAKRWSHSTVRLCCLLSLVVCVLAPSLASGVDGNAWLKLPENVRAGYLVGVFDGWAVLQSEGEAYRKRHSDAVPGYIENVLDGLKDCHKGKPPTQLIAIVDKYVKDHPEDWHFSMASLVSVALGEQCIKQ